MIWRHTAAGSIVFRGPSIPRRPLWVKSGHYTVQQKLPLGDCRCFSGSGACGYCTRCSRRFRMASRRHSRKVPNRKAPAARRSKHRDRRSLERRLVRPRVPSPAADYHSECVGSSNGKSAGRAPPSMLSFDNPGAASLHFWVGRNPPWKRQRVFPSSTLTKHLPPPRVFARHHRQNASDFRLAS